MLSHMPKPLGIEMVMRACVDSDHATDPIARKSRTSFLAHLQNAPNDWTSKQQAGVKPSTSGSKFTATKQCIEYIRSWPSLQATNDGDPVWSTYVCLR